MLLVMMGWVLFRAADIASAGRMFAGLLGLNGAGGRQGFSDSVVWQVTPDRLGVLVLGVALVYAMPWIKRSGAGFLQQGLRWLLVPLFLWALATLLSQAFTPFLYFQF